MTEAPPTAATGVGSLPAAELHVHLETSLRLRRLAERDLGGPAPLDEPHLVADPSRFNGYDRLRRLRYAGRVGRIPDELYTRERIARITEELLGESAARGVRYVEVRVGGRRAFELLGIRGMLEAMAEARERAHQRHGIAVGYIVCIVRERGPEEAHAVAREAAAGRDCGVVGIDVAGDEANYPPYLFQKAVDIARAAGLGITVHAGEFAGAASVWTAIYQLGAQRIGHGIRAIDDAPLLDYLREKRVTLELCPTSNVRLGLVASYRDLPIKRFLQAGVPVTVNSDDPLLLGTDLRREYMIVARECGLSHDDLLTLARNAARAAFLPPADRARLEAEIAGAPSGA